MALRNRELHARNDDDDQWMQWCSGRVSDSEPRGCGFDSHLVHWDCKALLVTSLAHVSGAITSVPYRFNGNFWYNWYMSMLCHFVFLIYWNWQSDRQIQTERQTNKQTDRQTNRQTQRLHYDRHIQFQLLAVPKFRTNYFTKPTCNSAFRYCCNNRLKSDWLTSAADWGCSFAVEAMALSPEVLSAALCWRRVERACFTELSRVKANILHATQETTFL